MLKKLFRKNLFKAVEQCDVKTLAHAPADAINSVDETGASVLVYACRNGSVQCAEALLKAGSDVNFIDNNGYSSLIYALKGRDETLVKLLLSHGAITENIGPHRFNAMDFAAEQGFEAGIRVLIEAGCVFSIFHIWKAPDAKETERLFDLIDKRILRRSKNEYLMKSCSKACLHAVMYLTEYGAEINCCDEQERTPLMYAARAGSISIIKFLIEKGADPFLKDIHGCTASISASGRRHDAAAEFLRAVMEKQRDNYEEKRRESEETHRRTWENAQKRDGFDGFFYQYEDEFKKNFYEILGIKKDADSKVLKQAYYAKMKEYHPDKYSAHPEWICKEAARRSKILNHIYEILSDSLQRSNYDAWLNAENQI